MFVCLLEATNSRSQLENIYLDVIVIEFKYVISNPISEFWFQLHNYNLLWDKEGELLKVHVT